MDGNVKVDNPNPLASLIDEKSDGSLSVAMVVLGDARGLDLGPVQTAVRRSACRHRSALQEYAGMIIEGRRQLAEAEANYASARADFLELTAALKEG